MLLRACLLVIVLPALNAGSPDFPTYRRLQLSDQFFGEGAAFGDLNRDGHADAIAGPYWHEGPGFTRRHELYAPAPFDPLKYSDNFFVFTRDFNADGWLDVLIVGFPGKDTSWYQNPGDSGRSWQKHLAHLPTQNEAPTFGDLLGTGQPVLVCMSRGGVGYATPNPRDPTALWTFHPVTPPAQWQRFAHALGFGDINGDRRPDVLGKDGWWEQPSSLAGDPIWKHHPVVFSPARGGAQMYSYDVNGDGRADVIAGLDAHGYGLSWFEQTRSSEGAITFREHRILSGEPAEKISNVQFSQLHAIELADLDGDGLLDIVTGKRWWAHGPKGDPDPNGTPVIYGFLLRRAADGTATYVPHRIDDASGVGTQVVATDINSDGRADVIAANKRGTFVFLTQEPKTAK